MVRRLAIVILFLSIPNAAPRPDATADYIAFLRSTANVSFNQFEIKHHCNRVKENFQRYCDGANALPFNAGRLQVKLEAFCLSYAQGCREEASQAPVSGQVNSKFMREQVATLSAPPSMLTSSELIDQRASARQTEATKVSAGSGRQANRPSAAVIFTCTPDCTEPHCTTACKCDNLNAIVYANCSPPSNSHVATICQAWYAKCPMYKTRHE